jgi:hypothetical protein
VPSLKSTEKPVKPKANT